MVALGGNALLRRGEPADFETQRGHAAAAVEAVAALARELELIITHGNGPQVGLLALQAEAYEEVPAYPLDVLGAESEGMIGYLLEQELANAVADRPVATLLTQVVVEGGDPAFSEPTKPIGPLYDQATAERLRAERGWAMVAERAGQRRAVASPEPVSLVELEAIRVLVEAVVDKDLVAALLARELGADALLLLTDVAAVETDWGTPSARPLAKIGAAELPALELESGSMGRKVEAARRFATATGGLAAIGALEDAAAILHGERGTRIEP